MNSLRLMLPDNHIPDRRSRQQVKHGIRVRPLRLLVAAPFRPLEPLHAPVESRPRGHVEGILQDDRLLRPGELRDGEGEAWGRALEEVGLGRVRRAGLAVALGGLALLEGEELSACGRPVEDSGGGDEGGEDGEEKDGLHCGMGF